MRSFYLFLALAFFISCNNNSETKEASTDSVEKNDYISQKLAGYATVRLTTDLNHLSDSDKKVIPLLIEAAKIMDTLFWLQSYGNPDSLLKATTDEKAKQFIMVNYGPWD